MNNIFPKIIASVVLGSVILTNFAFAQTPITPSASRGNIVLNKQSLENAKTEAGCRQFRDDVYYVFSGQFKAIWGQIVHPPGGPGGVPYIENAGCHIVPSNWPDTQGLYGSITNIPQGARDLQDMIREGKGISSAQVTAAYLKDIEVKNDAGWFSELVGWALNAILSVVNAVLLWMSGIAGSIFTTAVDWILKGGEMPNFVYIGWAIVRDISNMFFILILIVIGLAAILRIESYDYRHLLVETVIMALLVNFSMVIATTLLDVVGTLTAIFATRHGEIWAFVYGYVNFGDLATIGSSPGWMGGLFQGITKIIFTFVSLATFLALAGLFVVRIVGVYVLVIFSPLAYVLDVLPATKHFAHEWWQYFMKYLIWPPVALFVMRIAMLMVQDKSWSSGDSTFNIIILMAMLWGAVIMAEHAGMVGGKAVVNGAEKFAHTLGHGLQHAVGGYVGRKWNERTLHLLESHDGKEVPAGNKVMFAILNPIAAYKGSQQRSHELSHMAQEEAAAGGREVVEQAFTTRPKFLGGTGKPKLSIPYRQFVARKDEDMFLKDYGNMKKETLMRAAVDAEGMTGFEGEARKRAIVKAAAANGYLDDLMRMKPFAEKYTGSDNVVYGAESLNRFLYGYLGEGEQAKRFMAEDMEELGKKAKHFEYLGHAYYDPDKKEWSRGIKAKETATKPNEFVKNGRVFEKVKRGDKEMDVEVLDMNKDSWMVKYSTGEFAKLGGRDRVGAAPHNFTVVRAEVNTDGSFKDTGSELSENLTFGRDLDIDPQGFDVYNKTMLRNMDADVMREVQHAQARVKKWLLSDELHVGSNGAIVIDDEEHERELKILYDVNPEFVKGLYTKVLKVKGDAREQIDGIRYVVKRPDGSVGSVQEITDEGLGKSTFVYTEKPPKVSNPRLKKEEKES
jgi:hypothetical protein